MMSPTPGGLEPRCARIFLWRFMSLPRQWLLTHSLTSRRSPSTQGHYRGGPLPHALAKSDPTGNHPLATAETGAFHSRIISTSGTPPSLPPITNRVSRLDTLRDRLLFALLGTSLLRPTVPSQAVNETSSRSSPDSEKVKFPFSLIGLFKKRKESCVSCLAVKKMSFIYPLLLSRLRK